MAVVIQNVLAKLGVGLMLQDHVVWGMNCMELAIRMPRFLSDFLITTCGNSGVFHFSKLHGTPVGSRQEAPSITQIFRMFVNH
ncbi:conjugal transfer protein TrbL family protein [Paenibacillaceae bacterium WGS1546]|uniref:conjugal transfer protein TrbL family protein n=1 Tax=Cohnella sp. WGS1546 TaxID=3366810 RepID=UPI00372D6B4A